MSDRYGVIFDMDGVLVDSYTPHYQSWRQAAAERGVELTEQWFAAHFGMTGREMVATIWTDDVNDAFIAEINTRKESLYRDIISNEIPACPGLLELLDALSQDNAVMAVGSSGPPENVDLVLDGLNIRDYFKAIVNGMDVTRGKPDPQVFLICAERMEIAPARCIVIEDAPAGIQAARRAGAGTVGITTSYPREKIADADLVIDALSDLTASDVRALLAGG